MASEFEIKGLNAVMEQFASIKHDVKYKGGRFALRKAANLIQSNARKDARRIDDPATAEVIAKNVAVRWNSRKFKVSGDLAFRIGVLGGAREYANTKANVRSGKAGKTYRTGGDKSNPGGDTWYWRHIEFGTSKMAAQPFLRPALANNVDAATEEFVQQYRKALERTVAKGKK